ncbi:MAG TPA: oligosaccharide flippase family protein, partial [Solirubrobacteraceae bacterium]|nr:oligosaccharide flippase family protein [Solirubrobacteraceae bacterium]
MGDDSQPPEQLRDAAAHGIRWSAIARPTIEIVQLASIVVLARLIAPAEFGRYAIALIAQEVTYVIGGAGLSDGLIQRKQLDREHLQAGMAIALLTGIGLTAVTFVAANLVVSPVFGHKTAVFVRMMSPLGLLAALNAVPISILARRMDFRRLSEVEVCTTVLRVAASVALAIVGLGGEALVLGIVIGSLLGMMFAWVSAPPPLPRLRRQPARELLSYAAPVSLASISWVGFGNVAFAIVGARLGPLQNGYYFRAYTLAVEYQRKLAIVMDKVGLPVLARSRNTTEVARLYRQMARMLTIIIFPLLVVLAITAPVLVPFAFGSRWDAAVAPTQILALGGAAAVLFNAVATVFKATARTGALMGFGWIQFVVYGVTVYLTAPLGLTAIAIGAAIVHTLFAVIAYVMMFQGTEESPLAQLWSDVAPAMISCLGLTAVVLPASIVLTAAHTPAALWLLALGLLAAPPYLLTLRVCFPAAWRSQCAALERILPGHRRLNG